jgi:DsbC/DsbD-like thiol-disulfide interchange protein
MAVAEVTEQAATTRQSAERITALAQAFRALGTHVPGLSVEVVGNVRDSTRLVHPVAGFTVKLQESDGRVGAALYVSTNYGELTSWRQPDGDGGAVRERFDVHLNEGFVWGGSAYPTAEPLATDLLGYLQFNFDRARDP